MGCANYYMDDLLYGFYLFLIGLLIGLIIILFLWLCLKFISCHSNKVTDTKRIIKYNINVDKKLLIKHLNNMSHSEENVEGNLFIFYNHFDKWKNIHRNYINIIGHIDNSNLFILNESINREDIIRFDDLEFHYRNERISGHRSLHQQLINMLLKNKLINEEEHEQYCKRLEKRYISQVDQFNNECDSFLNDLRANAPKGTTESEIQVLIAEKFPQKADLVMNNIINDQSSEIREMILKVQVNKALSNEDVDSIFSMYLRGKHHLDECINENQAALRLRIAKRLENLKSNFNEEVIDDNVRVIETEERAKNILINIQNTLPDLSEAERQKIINEYKGNVDKIRRQHDADFLAQKVALSTKMENARKKDLEKVFSSYETDFVKQAQYAEKVSLEDSDTSLNKYQQLKTNIDDDANLTIESWDQKEITEIKNLKDSFTQLIEEEINDAEFKLLEDVYVSHGIDNYSINDILRQHQNNNKSLRNTMNKERQRQIQKMNDMMEKRKSKNDVELMDGIRNQCDQEDKQQQIVNKAMNDQMELPLELKNKIIQDSKSNEINIRNQLSSLKIRQQKQLELALAKKMCANVSSQKAAKESLNLPQVDIYEEEEKKIEIDKDRIILEMRDKLTNETKDMLSHYEDEIRKIMAMHQVNHAKDARKKKNLQTLYDNLCNELSRPALEQNPLATQQVIEQFTNDKNNLENIKSNSQQEQKKLMEKKLEDRIGKIKSQKQGELKRRFTDQLKAFKDGGVGDAALTIANDLMVDKMDEETENAVKTERRKEAEAFAKSNDRYEKDIENELLNKKKDIVSRLVLITDMKTSQISDLIDGINPNLDDETKKTIINEIKRKTNQNSKEKTFYQFQKSENSNDEYDNPNKTHYSEQNGSPVPTKKKKKKMKLRQESTATENIDSDF